VANSSPRQVASTLRTSLSLTIRTTVYGIILLALLMTALTRTLRAQAQQQPGAAPVATANQPPLPSYFSGLKGPDATGNNYGVWATPSGTPNANGSPSGDVPSKLTIADLYDRVMHNQYALNIVWTGRPLRQLLHCCTPDTHGPPIPKKPAPAGPPSTS
jgi:hypothetical protein